MSNPDAETVPPPGAPPRAEAVVDLDAISANVSALSTHVDGRDVMAVVKADGYGHGLVPSAKAARAGGASWLGVAFLEEALALRAAGDSGPILSWLAVPGEQYDAAIAASVELGVYSVAQLAEIAAAARSAGGSAAIQIKVDTGLSRGGADASQWDELLTRAAALQRAGLVRVTGLWSHLAASDDPGHPANKQQLTTFDEALAMARRSGLEPPHVHLANSGAILANPAAWHTMVRPGIAIYGFSPLATGSAPVTLRPAMTVRATVALVKELPAGAGISYGHTHVTERPTRVALIPLGYGDGIPRHASNRAAVSIAGTRCPILGRVCMDQFVVDIGDLDVRPGDEVVVFGDSAHQGWIPTATDWADAVDTIDYEIVTRIGAGTTALRRIGRMSRRRSAGLVGLAAGLVAAGVATGIAAERRLAGRLRDEQEPTTPFGSLRGEGHEVTADDGLSLYAEVDPPDEGAHPHRPTIVLVHGYALNLDCWYFQREVLRDNHRLVLYDQRSHGRSARSRRAHCTIEQTGRDLRCVIEQLVPDGPVILVGHSMGGMSVMALAEQNPELFGTKIVGVGLIATSAGGLDFTTLGLAGAPGRLAHNAAPLLIAALARMPKLVDRGRRASSDMAFAATKRLAFASEGVSDELVEFTDEMLSATPFEVVLDFFSGFGDHDRYAALGVLGWVPTVVICGDDDLLTPPRHSQRIVELVPGAELVEVADAGHMVLLDHATEVNQALFAMISRAERKRRRERPRRS